MKGERERWMGVGEEGWREKWGKREGREIDILVNFGDRMVGGRWGGG